MEGAAEQASTQADILFSPWPGTIIVESFGGFGETLEERVEHAVRGFAANTFHVLLAAFLGGDHGDQTDRERFTNAGIARVATHGNVACAGDPELATSTDWYAGFLELLAAHPISPGTHWIRLYYAQDGGKQLGIELLLDNERWSAAEPSLGGIDWPKGAGYFSMRMFMVVQGGADLGVAVGVMALHPRAEDDEIRHLLTRAGLTPVEARRASIIVPLAFGKELFEGIAGYPESCEVRSGESRSTVTISGVPGFREAAAIARRARWDGSLTRGQYVSIAMRDALARAVNDALNAGQEVREAKASIVVLWPEEVAFGYS